MSPDQFLRLLFGLPPPQRNDCGYEHRFEHEDTSRMLGRGPAEGEGLCDYPSYCPLWRAGRCPLTDP